MRSTQKHGIALSLIVCVVLFAGASLALAHSGETSECGICHTTTNVLILTSNATGTVNAVTGKPFTLIVDSTGYSRGDNKVAISVQAGWADNNQFSFTPTEVMDGSGSDLNPTTDEVRASLSFTPQSVGSWTIRIYTAGKGDLSKALDISVSVTSSDTTPPTIDSPLDQTISEENATASVTWNPADANPNSYEVFDNGVSWQSGTWDGSPISVTLGTLTLGFHNLTLIVWDDASNSATDEVDVSVYDGTAPVLDSPSDVPYSEGTTGNSIVWDPTDLHPSSYVLYRDGTPIKSGTWNDTLETISVTVDGLSLGTYNYTILVTDVGSNTATDTVWVTVSDGTAPTVDSPADVEYNEGQTGNSISWNPSDLHPSSYVVYMEESPYKSGAWNSSSETITVSVDGLSVGTYNFTVEVADVGGNSASDMVLVILYDATPPTVDSPSNVTYAEGNTGYSITWDPADAHPSSYVIYRDGTPVKSGLWNDTSETISISVDGLGLGSYNYTIEVADVGSNTAVDTVWVDVYDGTAPTIDSPTDVVLDEGTTSSTISWNPSDLNPSSYIIYRDGSPVRSGAWNSSLETISVSLDGLILGIYNFTSIVYDVGSNSVSDTVFVTVVDGTPSVLDSPLDVSYNEGQTGNSITWNPSDLHPSSYVVFIDAQVIASGSWNDTSETITLNVDGLSLGTHNYTLLVTDVGSNSASDQVDVIVSASTTGTTTTTSTTTTTTTTTTGTTTPGPITGPDYVVSSILTIALSWTGSVIVIVVVFEAIRRREE
ncbi:MAG: hypothetical protein ACE5H4_08150 [Candidatus Thorarchaeota archaeon]